jgi:enterochelin esterase family protein
MKLSQLILFINAVIVLAACQIQNPLIDPTETPILTPTFELKPDPTPSANTVAGFDQFLDEIKNARQDDRQQLVDRYTAQLTQAPLTGGNRAVFLWRGAAFSVHLLGDMNNWLLEDSSSLARIEGTDLWYLTAEYEENARLDYQLVLDGENWQLDPLNPNRVVGQTGPNSELIMSAYETPPELVPSVGKIPSGTLSTHTLDSNYLNQTRTFFVYVPSSQLIGEQMPTVYVNDGSDYLNLIDTPAILDNLIAKKLIPPVVAVFIPPISENDEYSLDSTYLDFLSKELVPMVQRTYGTDRDPAKTAIIGSALGGISAINTVVTSPSVFGLAAGFSPDIPQSGTALLNRVRRGDPRDTRLYLAVGTYETAVNTGTNVDAEIKTSNLLAANQELAELLSDRGYDHQYEERPEGHSWGLWRGSFGRALIYLLTE